MIALTEKRPVRVRFAPSPTGPFHIGSARTTLFNWLFARQNNGVFILRIEDTDRERSLPKYEDEIMDGLHWLGLDWDEGPLYTDQRGLHADKRGLNADPSSLRKSAYVGDYGPYRQSERIKIYKKYLEKLLKEEKAYYCYCTKEELGAEKQAMLAQGLPPKYSGHCRNLEKPPVGREPQVIRFKTPEVRVEFKDIVRGKVSFDASLFGDLIIAKDLETPLYNFAATVDDAGMKISHVIRGEDHISNTPKQILLQKALGFDELEYAHLPLILNPDRSKLSSRFTETSLLDYRTQGYLPEAIVNFLVLLGWHPKNDKEVFMLDELVHEFELKRVQKAGAVFTQDKLDWLQKEHLKNLSTDEIVKRVMPLLVGKKIKASEEFVKKVVALEKTRLKTLNEFLDVAGFFFKLPDDYEPQLLVWQKEPLSKIKTVLEKIAEIMKALEKKEINREAITAALSGLVDGEGRGAVLWPLRAALSGQTASPDPFDIVEVLGVKESINRIEAAIAKIDKSLEQK